MSKEKKTKKLNKKLTEVEKIKIYDPVTNTHFSVKKASPFRKRNSRELFKNLDLS